MGISREQFEQEYAYRSGISLKYYRQLWVTLPCECDYEDCQGWSCVPRSFESILTHLDLHAPELPIDKVPSHYICSFMKRCPDYNRLIRLLEPKERAIIWARIAGETLKSIASWIPQANGDIGFKSNERVRQLEARAVRRALVRNAGLGTTKRRYC